MPFRLVMHRIGASGCAVNDAFLCDGTSFALPVYLMD